MQEKLENLLYLSRESTLSRLTLFYTGVGLIMDFLRNPWLNTPTKAKLPLEATFLIIIFT